MVGFIFLLVEVDLSSALIGLWVRRAGSLGNEPKTVRWTVFGEVLSPKQGVSFTRLRWVGEATMRRDGDARSDNPKVIRAKALFKSCLRNQKEKSRKRLFLFVLFTFLFSLFTFLWNSRATFPEKREKRREKRKGSFSPVGRKALIFSRKCYIIISVNNPQTPGLSANFRYNVYYHPKGARKW